MPTYQYACKACGEPLEVVQSFHDAPLTECPHCAGELRKVFSSVGVVFKGSGFYRNDSRDASKGKASSSGSGSESGKSESSKSDSSKSDSSKSEPFGKSDSSKSEPSGKSDSSKSESPATKSEPAKKKSTGDSAA